MVQGQRNGRRRRVAMVVDRQDDLVHGQFQFFSRTLDDADVGLMRNQPVDVGVLQAGFLEDRARSTLEQANGELEDRLTVHLQHWIAQNIPVSHMTGHTQNAHMFAVSVNVRRQNTWRLGRFQHHGARTVTKQHAGRAVLEIEQARENLRTHHQRTFGVTRADHGIGHGQGVNKTTAHGLHIKSRSTSNACRCIV